MAQDILLPCTCGTVRLRVAGAHILSTECCCESCRKAGAHLQSLPGAPRVLKETGATPFVLHRKDRVRCDAGPENLKEYRLTPDAPTRRVVAACCNTPMFLEFTHGHWLSLYADRFPPENLPPLQLRTMTRDLPQGTVLPDDVPNPKTHSLAFFARLVAAWAAMGFRTPKITFVNGALDAP